MAATEIGVPVTLYEAARHYGGRCRSYYESTLDLVIDNGNHLLLSGNDATLSYLSSVGASGSVYPLEDGRLPLLDLGRNQRWRFSITPWHLLAALMGAGRVPGTEMADYLSLWPALRAGPDRRLGDLVDCHSSGFTRLWHPIILAAMNTPPAETSCQLLRQLLRESTLRGARACRPLLMQNNLNDSLVEPAIAWLSKRQTELQAGHRLRSIDTDGRQLTQLVFTTRTVPLGPGDQVILALPPWAASSILADYPAPLGYATIVNAHYRFQSPPGLPPILGLIGGTGEWIFRHEEHVSVTVSAADALLEEDRPLLAARIWADVAQATGCGGPIPTWQIVSEKRATFRATPTENARRPHSRTRWHNLTLAGDWVQTGLPATIEGAIRSGQQAVALALMRTGWHKGRQ